TVSRYGQFKEYEALGRMSTVSHSSDTFIDANTERELGNEFFKKQRFNDAVDCYSRSIALSPTAAAFANRAMAYIKLKRFRDAENDCSEALDLDDRYIKAYSRRSTARKELGKLKEAIDDAEFALRLEPQNKELKKQFEETKSLLQKEILKKVSGASLRSVDNSPVLGKSNIDVKKNIQQNLHPITTVSSVTTAETSAKTRNTKKIAADSNPEDIAFEILLFPSILISFFFFFFRSQKKIMDQKQKLTASVQELAANAANVAKVEAAKNIVPPTSAYQFEVDWRRLSGDRNAQARLLKVTSPSALPGIFKSSLSASLLVDIIRCIGMFFSEDTALGIEYLRNLIEIPRFEVIVMCLSSADKIDVGRIWDEVFSQCSEDCYREIIHDLRPRF
ncbi:hypothetical protein M569_09478, partial [Genlisea aurea]